MEMPTQGQINTAIRYTGQSAATIGAMVVAAGAFPAANVHALVDAAQKVLTDLQQLVGDSYVLAGLAFPVVMFVIGKLGWNSARPENQKQSIIAAQPNTVIVETPSAATAVTAANAIVAAVPNVSKVITSQITADASGPKVKSS
jgi:hypothetical protein